MTCNKLNKSRRNFFQATTILTKMNELVRLEYAIEMTVGDKLWITKEM